MAYLSPQQDEHKTELYVEKKHKFSDTNDVRKLAFEIYSIDNLVEDHIEVFDIVWEILYAKDINNYNREQYNRILDGTIVVPEEISDALRKCVTLFFNNKFKQR